MSAVQLQNLLNKFFVKNNFTTISANELRDLSVKHFAQRGADIRSMQTLRKSKQIRRMQEIILNELNIKNIEFDDDFEKWVKYECKPNFSTLGPKLGNSINDFKNYLSDLSQEDIKKLISNKKLRFNNKNINITDVDIRLIKIGEKNNQEIVDDFSVYLNTEIDEELLKERISREMVSIIQKQRKDMGFDITDRISLIIKSQDEILLKSVEEFQSYIVNETLTTDLKIINSEASNKVLDYFVDTEIKIS